MKLSVLAVILLTASSCEAMPPEWGEKLFVIQKLRDWNRDAVARSCTARDNSSIFLFEKSREYFLITRSGGVYDITFINAKGDGVEIEANGGLGRYMEVQDQYEALRRVPGIPVVQNDYADYLDSVPVTRCDF